MSGFANTKADIAFLKSGLIKTWLQAKNLLVQNSG